MRRARNTDGNHAPARELLRALGCIVEDLSDVGRGIPDLLVRTRRGTVFLTEVKRPGRAKARRALDGQQALMAARWGNSYRVVETDEDCIELARS